MKNISFPQNIKNIKQQKHFNTDNNNTNNWATIQHIRIISEDSCDIKGRINVLPSQE